MKIVTTLRNAKEEMRVEELRRKAAGPGGWGALTLAELDEFSYLKALGRGDVARGEKSDAWPCRAAPPDPAPGHSPARSGSPGEDGER